MKDIAGSPRMDHTVRVIDGAKDRSELPIVEGRGHCWAILRPDNGAHYRTFNIIALKAGDRTVEMKHVSDSVYYVASGSGEIHDLQRHEVQSLSEGVMMHIDKGDVYRFVATANDGLKLIGGPCPADLDIYSLEPAKVSKGN